MRNFILCIAGHGALVHSDEGEKKNEERRMKTKKARAALAAGYLLQPSPQVLSAEQAIALDLSAAQSGMKDGCPMQSMTEFP